MQSQRKTSGGESFTVSMETSAMRSARVAMNRPRVLQRTPPTVATSTPVVTSSAPVTSLMSSKKKVSQTDSERALTRKRSTVVEETTATFAPLCEQGSFADVGPSEFTAGEFGTPVNSGDGGPAASTPLTVGDWIYEPPPNNQRSFYFAEDNLHFSSEFDSGNLIQVERVAAYRYNLYSCPDCGNSPQQTNNRQWFHFAVRGATKGTCLQMQMIGLMTSKMYSFGWTPVAAVMPSRPIYSRFATKVIVNKLESAPSTPGYPSLLYKQFPTSDIGAADAGDDDEGSGKKKGDTVAMNVSFEYRFEFDVPVDPQYPFGHPLCPALFIASNHPYSFQRCQKSIQQWRQAAIDSDGKIYFHREVLCKSLDGRPVDLLTISGASGMCGDQREHPYAAGIPLSSAKPSMEASGDIGIISEGAVTAATVSSIAPSELTERPCLFPLKKYVLLTARVHPGEAPASHILQGSVDMLFNRGDPRSEVLLQNYIFVVVPMINPDGVVRGHSRADTTGQNLNRMYRNPSSAKHPAIYSLRALMLSLQKTGRLALYIDMHAHANKKGAFFFGNAMNSVDQVQNMLYAKLVSLNTPHFEFNSCNFSESNMFAMGKNGETKDGSSRVTIFQETGFVHSYTIETSYVTGVVQNAVAANPMISGEEIDILPGTPSPKYNQTTFADVGKALLVSLLDLNQQNPASRLPQGPYRSLRGVTMWLQKQILYEVHEVVRKQQALKQGTPTSQVSSQQSLQKDGALPAANPSGGLNFDLLTPQTLPLAAVASLDIPEMVTTRANKVMPPMTIYGIEALIDKIRREKIDPPAAQVTSATRSAPAQLSRGMSSNKLVAIAGARRPTLTPPFAVVASSPSMKRKL